jgi:hypothetical protein
MHDQGDEIIDTLGQLHSAGWSIGDTGRSNITSGKRVSSTPSASPNSAAIGSRSSGTISCHFKATH